MRATAKAHKQAMPTRGLSSSWQEAAGLGPALCYEDMIEAQRPRLPGFQWARMEDDDACGLCYTSGTTGRPKVGGLTLPVAAAVTCTLVVTCGACRGAAAAAAQSMASCTPTLGVSGLRCMRGVGRQCAAGTGALASGVPRRRGHAGNNLWFSALLCVARVPCRACCTATGRRSCTRSAFQCLTRSTSARAPSSWPSCPCSTPTPGASPLPRRSRAPSWCCRVRAGAAALQLPSESTPCE